MKAKSIPASDVLAAHEKAALEIGELRRKGKPCHLEEHADAGGLHIDVIEDPQAEYGPEGQDRGHGSSR
ncbi:hypothetical protein [Luteolibacter marinus]|uniref:hypothetical protein n=1 Tax=Luteolibacter marinus TaxID=2776705 RepID=UPI0018684ADE|nr:hypothetical protein [Luteolibacter marinus]